MANDLKPLGERRSRAKLVGFGVIDPSPRTARAPKWPMDRPPTKAEARKWREVWRKPVARVWEANDCIELVCAYVRVVVAAIGGPKPNPKVMSELRQLDSMLGVSPKALKDLRLIVKELPRVVSPNDTQAVEEHRASVTEMRKRVRAVDDA